MNSERSIYDELREKCRRKTRTAYLKPYFVNSGSTVTGAYAMPYNPFEKALAEKKQRAFLARLRQAFIK